MDRRKIMDHPDPRAISAYLENDLGSEDHRDMEDHLAHCSECSDILQDLRGLRDRAGGLPDQVPSRDLWPGIARAIHKEAGRDPQDPDVIRLHPRVGGHKVERGLQMSWPQASAAGIVLALISGAIGGAWGGSLSAPPVAQGPDEVEETLPGWVALVEEARPELTEIAEEVARLERVLAEGQDVLDPGTRGILEKNLGSIDRAISESVAALREDPGNRFLETNLERAVRSRGEYLKDAAALAVPAT
jgi:hypothetical protein